MAQSFAFPGHLSDHIPGLCSLHGFVPGGRVGGERSLKFEVPENNSHVIWIHIKDIFYFWDVQYGLNYDAVE